jgi:hypothetical protein
MVGFDFPRTLRDTRPHTLARISHHARRLHLQRPPDALDYRSASPSLAAAQTPTVRRPHEWRGHMAVGRHDRGPVLA